MKLLFIFYLLNFSGGDFCEGFRFGFIRGYCYNKINCITPPIPPCPVPRAKDENSYESGFDRGFLLGQSYD
jgi:hypothetical protein